jgi:hypothetical protein
VALLAGAGAYFLGTATSGKPVATPSPTPSPSLALFEATQKTLNEAKFRGDLVLLAQPWLPYLGGCLADTDNRGPKLLSDESRHVFCRYGSVSVNFGLFKSEAAVSTERALRQRLKLPADSLVPGQEPPSQKTGGVSHVQGDYVEYSLKGQDGRPLCGIWWNREGSSAAMFMEALCYEALGGSWAPLRDLWQRYS